MRKNKNSENRVILSAMDLRDWTTFLESLLKRENAFEQLLKW